MGGAGDSPAPVGDPPTGMAKRYRVKARSQWYDPSFPFRPAGRRTAQAGRLCYPKSVIQTRSNRIGEGLGVRHDACDGSRLILPAVGKTPFAGAGIGNRRPRIPPHNPKTRS
jgi:hypothetical protein